MPSLFRIFKAGALGYFMIWLVLQGMAKLADTPPDVSESGQYLRASDSGLFVAAWAWAAVAGWTGAVLGLMFGREGFHSSLRVLLGLWSIFIVGHGVLYAVASPVGISYLFTINFAVVLGLAVMSWGLSWPEPTPSSSMTAV